ncbi:putative cilia- and flagella-associated protein 61 [Paratrimastix pyriformis]|uniref:Cilia- and flagella-associated protein 61 n=1 Tax=Paratrimastix pyriformis TaxID=342808 RepID=A0ABQ8UVQ4_9EUKA|nr:putative cilia- and flagella-associated protein 61 [Paratrimastix pyriformis]
MEVRKAELADQPAIQALIGESTQFQTLFGQYNLATFIESGVLSITVYHETDAIGFVSFCDYPTTITAGEPTQEAWEDWVQKNYSEDLPPFSTVWLSFGVCMDRTRQRDLSAMLSIPAPSDIMGHMIRSLFETLPHLERVCYLAPARASLERELPALAQFFTMAERKTFEDLDGPTLYLCKRELVSTTLYVRPAMVEDHDDLVPVFRDQSEALIERYGEFYLAELIQNQTDTDKTLVAERSFELEPFGNLVRGDGEDVAPNAFCISKFCLEPTYEGRSCDFLQAAFGLFPAMDYCIITLPHTVPEFALLNSRFCVEADSVGLQRARPAHEEGVRSLLTGLKDEAALGELFELCVLNQSPAQRQYDQYKELRAERRVQSLRAALAKLAPALEPDAAFLGGPADSEEERLFRQLDKAFGGPEGEVRPPAIAPTCCRPAAFHGQARDPLLLGCPVSIAPPDRPALTRPVGCTSAPPPPPPQAELARLQKHEALMRASLRCYVALCGETVVGLSVVAVATQVQFLRDHFELDFVSFRDHPDPSQGDVVCFVLSPVFYPRARFLVKELFRKTAKTCLYYRLYPACEQSISAPLLELFVPALPRRQVVRPLRQTDDPAYVDPDVQYADRHRLDLADDKIGPLGDLAPLDLSNPYKVFVQPRTSYCPPAFALNVLTRRMVFERKTVFNHRIVVVGASDCGLAVLSKLALAPTLSFTHLALLSPGGLPTALSTVVPPPGHHMHPHPAHGAYPQYCLFPLPRPLVPITRAGVALPVAGAVNWAEGRGVPGEGFFEADPPVPADRVVGGADAAMGPNPTHLHAPPALPPLPPLLPAGSEAASAAALAGGWTPPVRPCPSRPPAPPRYGVTSCNFWADELAALALGSRLTEVDGTMVDIDRQQRMVVLAGGTMLPYDLLVIASGLQDQTLKRIAQQQQQAPPEGAAETEEDPLALDVADGVVTLSSEAQAQRLHEYLTTAWTGWAPAHHPKPAAQDPQAEEEEKDPHCSPAEYGPNLTRSLLPGGGLFGWAYDPTQIGVVYGNTLAAYSAVQSLLAAGVAGSRLYLIRPPSPAVPAENAPDLPRTAATHGMSPTASTTSLMGGGPSRAGASGAAAARRAGDQAAGGERENPAKRVFQDETLADQITAALITAG